MVDLSTLRGLDLPRRVATRGFQGLPADVREELVDELVGLDQNLREVANRIQDQVAHTHSASDITSGEFNIARIPDIPETKVTDGSILARLAGTETITGTWTFNNRIAAPAAGISIGGATNYIRLDGGRMDIVIGGTVVWSVDSSGNARALGDVLSSSTP